MNASTSAGQSCSNYKRRATINPKAPLVDLTVSDFEFTSTFIFNIYLMYIPTILCYVVTFYTLNVF